MVRATNRTSQPLMRPGHLNAQAGCWHVSRLLQARIDALVALVSQAALQAWRRMMGLVGADWRARPEQGSDPELGYLQAIVRLRTESLEASERRFAKLREAHPTSLYAIEEHGAILDRLGQRERSSASYELARTARQRLKRGMPDRPFFMRHRTTSVAEINGYTNVLRAGPSKRGAFVYVARGHAYLATRRPRLALLDYDAALKLKPDQTHLFVAKGEALAALGRHAEALQALDLAVADRPQDADALGSRAVVLLALGRIAEANADWLRQLELLPRERHDARACVCLRLATYEMALDELEAALERSAGDPYLQLYYLTAARRLRVPAQPGFSATDAWPGPLISFHQGKLTADEALQRADTPERRVEALFQIGICAAGDDRDEACRSWRQVVESAVPDTIEYAAARHEIEKLGAVTQSISFAPATTRGMITEATS
jgi:tetratricopeptide (TPR) repeat protein